LKPAFVGRDQELGVLHDALLRARQGSGSTVFVAGELGSGKQALLEELERRALEDPALADALFAKGGCDREHGAQSAYEPFAGLLLDLIEEQRANRVWKAIFEAVKEVAPDWLGIVPIAGPALEAGVKTALKAQELYASEAAEERARRAESRHVQFVAALDARLERTPLVVLTIAQAQWIDSASASLLERVARLVASRPVLILVTYRPGDIEEGHPLRGVERGLRIDDLATTIVMTGLDVEALDRLARESRGLGVAPDVGEWLVSFTEGNPLFVTELLPVLESRGVLLERDGAYVFHEDASVEDGELRLVGALAGSDIPIRISDALDERIERLDAANRDLLGIAAVEGSRFLTSTLARVSKAEEAALLRQLSAVEERHHLIRYSEALQRALFRYEFAHLLLHQRIYDRLSEPLRLQYHAQVADALVETWGEDAPRPVLLDIARHYEEGLDRPAAARFLLKAAESAQIDGASPHAASLSRRALALLDDSARGPRPPDTDALRAQLVALLVGAEWENAEASSSELPALLTQGRAAADRSGDPALRARLMHAQARYVLGTSDARAAVSTLQQARELAHEAGDPVVELAIAIDLGNTLAIEDLEQALATLREAHALFETQLAARESTDSELVRLRGRLIAFIGIGEFDRRNLGEAGKLLDESVSVLRAHGRTDDLPRILNYRAQVALASGDFEAAERDLHDAIDAGGFHSTGPWACYNQALLGKVQLESGRADLAGETLRAAWSVAQRAWQVRLGTIVRQYLAEFLLRDGSSNDEVNEAATLLEAQVADAAQSGFTNMLAGAYSLTAEVELRRNRAAPALEASARALEIIEEHGDVAITRTEEVLWRHARCLTAAGKPGAEDYLAKARAVLEEKAASLPSETARQRLLTVTPVARALAQAT
jgi:predicted ATPase